MGNNSCLMDCTAFPLQSGKHQGYRWQDGICGVASVASKFLSFLEAQLGETTSVNLTSVVIKAEYDTRQDDALRPKILQLKIMIKKRRRRSKLFKKIILYRCCNTGRNQ